MAPIYGVIIAYLAGSIPSAYIAGKLRGVDLRQQGSGNLGASTVAVTNGTVLYFIDETGTSPPVVQVFEQ